MLLFACQFEHYQSKCKRIKNTENLFIYIGFGLKRVVHFTYYYVIKCIQVSIWTIRQFIAFACWNFCILNIFDSRLRFYQASAWKWYLVSVEFFYCSFDSNHLMFFNRLTLFLILLFFHFFITGRRRHMGTRLNKLALYISIFILFTSSGLSGKSKVIVFSSWAIFTFGSSTKEIYTLLYEQKEYSVVI